MATTTPETYLADLNPAQRAYVLGLPASLRELSVSVADAATLGAALIEAPEKR